MKQKTNRVVKVKPINFFGIFTKPQKQNKLGSPSFLSVPKVNGTFWSGKPEKLFSKESTKNKRLSKWGDADMDGSPNAFDCDPRIFSKDAKKNKKIDFTKSQKQRLQFRKAISLQRQEELQRIKDIAELKKRESIEKIERKREEMKQFEQLKVVEKEKKRASGRRRAERTYLEEKERLEKSSKPISTYKGVYNIIKDKPKLLTKVVTGKIEGGRKRAIKEFMSIQVESPKLRATVEDIQSAIARGKEPSRKLIKEEAKIKKDLEERRKPLKTLGKVWMTKSPISKKTERAVTRGVQSVSKALFSTPVFTEGPRTKGRPGGPSGRYRIEGKPVYEQQWQDYQSKQRALNRMSPSAAQETPVPENITAEDYQQMQDQTQVEAIPQEYQQVAQSQQMPVEPNRPLSDQEYESMYLNEDERKLAAQLKAQEEDNVLKAPNFSKGELKATGGSLLTSVGPQILDAPNFNRGEMRTLNKGTDIPAVKLGPRPQTNPMGDTYVEIDVSSGKPRIMKRTSEKWMTGEAL